MQRGVLFETLLNNCMDTISSLLENKKITIREVEGDVIHISIVQAIMFSLQAISAGMETVLMMGGKRIGNKLSTGELKDLNAAINRLCKIFQVLKLGKLEAESINESECVLSLQESAFAAGNSNAGKPLCYIISGIIAGFLEGETGSNVHVYESKCIGLGHDKCEFIVKLSK